MTILCYHAVESGWRSPLAVTPEAFEQHCGWLSHHRTIVDLADAVTRLGPNSRLPKNVAVLTFDDGFSSLYEHALPILQRHDLPATVFLVAETLTPSGRSVDWVDPPPPRPLATLTLSQVQEMQAAGVRFGSHSYSHHDLTTLDETACERDLRMSREFLEDLLGTSVPFLAYPRGRHDARVRRAAQRAGYEYAFSLPERREPVGRFTVPRVGIWPQNGLQALRVKSTQGYLTLRTSRAFPAVRSMVRVAATVARRTA